MCMARKHIYMLNKGILYSINQIGLKIISDIIQYTYESLKINHEDYSVESVIKGELK
ncbi:MULTISPECIES: hypothetical protein [Methanobacterium]|uniref:Uncharacterized protein n=1 Tax=Methanobacterium veterum TaxID=408577 RepID=A0A9E5A4C7_9EURY|nr:MULTISPECIES: hypothetical protein [Methanobacterium]MCZ3373280.1 hypothetical protein [Methanobacterium veterum]